MRWSRCQISLSTWLALVALFAVCASVVSREAKKQRGAIMSGDVLVVDVLETLPGYQITGEYQVRPNGSIDLGYYGSLSAVNFTVDGLKTRLIGHLRKYLSDEALDLAEGSPTSAGRADPARSASVYVDMVSCKTEGEFILPAIFLDYINNFCRLDGHRQKVPGRSVECCALFTPASPEEKAVEFVRTAIQTPLEFRFRPLPIIAGLWLLRKRLVDKLAFLSRRFLLTLIRTK